MEDKKNYLEKLGFNPDEQPSQEDIEKRYEQYISEHMVLARQGKSDEQSDNKMQEITEAYNELTGRQKVDYDNKWYEGINKKTFKNFIYLFKGQIIAAICILLVIGVTIYEFTHREIVDFQVVTAGNITYDSAVFETKVKEVVPDVQGISIKSFENLSYEGFLAMYIAGDLDLVMVDAEYYEQFAKQGYLMDLDDLAKKYDINLKKQQDYIVKDEDDENPHLYGVDASGCPLIKEAIINDGIVIGVLRRKEVNEKAEIYIEKLFEQLSKVK